MTKPTRTHNKTHYETHAYTQQNTLQNPGIHTKKRITKPMHRHKKAH